MVEPLGNASDVIVDLDGTPFTARVPGFGELSPGDPVMIDTGRATVHCFDPESGLRR